MSTLLYNISSGFKYLNAVRFLLSHAEASTLGHLLDANKNEPWNLIKSSQCSRKSLNRERSLQSLIINFVLVQLTLFSGENYSFVGSIIRSNKNFLVLRN